MIVSHCYYSLGPPASCLVVTLSLGVQKKPQQCNCHDCQLLPSETAAMAVGDPAINLCFLAIDMVAVAKHALKSILQINFDCSS